MAMPRITDKAVREVADILMARGYEFVRRTGGHYVFKHEDFDRPFTIPSSPSDYRWFANSVAEIRRRHPELRPARSSSAGPPKPRRTSAQRERKLNAKLTATVRRVARAKAADAPVVPARTSCVDCGRRWLSDRRPLGPCPDCGAAVVLGREERKAA